MILDGREEKNIRRAAETLAAGELIGLPTETVYGLGARADQDKAVARVFAAKGRPADHPLIVHVLGREDAERFAEGVTEVAQRLMDAFWPGPLTVILRRASGVAAAAAGGQSTIGLRSPSHPVARALLGAARELGVDGVAAPSANRFGHVSPTTAHHVAEELGDSLLILDGGECELGIESSIVDCSRADPALLRPGMLSRAQIESVAGLPLRQSDASAPRAPGTLDSHYAPRARVRLFSEKALLARWAEDLPSGLAVYARADLIGRADSLSPRLRRMPADVRETARELFAVLREFDAAGMQEIWVELPPPAPEWEAVRDRLLRAASAVSE